MMERYTPEDLAGLVKTRRSALTDVDFQNSSKAKPLREAWIASRFGLGYVRHVAPCQIEIDVDDALGDHDFVLHAQNAKHTFESTIVEVPDRKRGLDYRRVAAGEIEIDRLMGWEAGTENGVDWIAAGLKKKVGKLYSDAARLNVLVYANISGGQIDFDGIKAACGSDLSTFASVWVMSDLRFGSLRSSGEIGVVDGWGNIDPPNGLDVLVQDVLSRN